MFDKISTELQGEFVLLIHLKRGCEVPCNCGRGKLSANVGLTPSSCPPQGDVWAEPTFIHAFLKDPIKLKVFEDSPFLPLLKILAVKRGRDNADLPLNFRSTE